MRHAACISGAGATSQWLPTSCFVARAWRACSAWARWLRRGQDISAAITLQAYLEAREQGFHVGVLFATGAGVPVYRRLGFREVGAISRYLWRAA
jgi:hypothetical protein